MWDREEEKSVSFGFHSNNAPLCNQRLTNIHLERSELLPEGELGDGKKLISFLSSLPTQRL